MRTVNVHEAKTHLSRLLDDVAAGEEIILAKAGKPYARLVPLTKPDLPKKRPLGMFAHLLTKTITLEDLAWSDEELQEWEDNPIFPHTDASP